MTAPQLRALEYVKNTGGGATKQNFIEDHEPIGEILWSELSNMGLVMEKDGKIWPSDKGNEILNRR